MQQRHGTGGGDGLLQGGCGLCIGGTGEPGLPGVDQPGAAHRHGAIAGQVCQTLRGIGDAGFLRGRGVIAVIQPDQHDRRLLPGGSLIRGEGGGRSAVHQPQLMGHGDIAHVGGHISEGHGQVLGQTGDGAVAHSPHQHDRQLLPGDGLPGAERIRLPGDGPVGIGGLHRAVIPGTLVLVVRIGPGLRCYHLPAEQAAQGHHKGPPGHGSPQAEAGGRLPLEQAQVHSPTDGVRRPVALRHVGKAGGGRCRGRRQRRCHQQGAEQRAGTEPLQSSFHVVILRSFSVRFLSDSGRDARIRPLSVCHCTRICRRRQTNGVGTQKNLYVSPLACYNNLVMMAFYYL